MLFAIGMFLALSVTSCGDDDDDDNPNSSNPSNNGQQGGSNPDSNVTPKPDDNGSNSEPAKTFTVTFNTDGGSEVVAQNVEEGKTATKPEDPTKDGFYFLGWYVGENLYDFTLPVSNDLTITALWMVKTEYDVVLGLPSGAIWATCNVGAENPWNCGDYFAWGETTTKDVYSQDTYIYSDEPSTLDASHDAASVNMGSLWRMPTETEFQELIDNCEWEWTDDYNGTGVAGHIVKSRNNSNSLFLPAVGYLDFTDLIGEGSYGYYRSSSIYDADYAMFLFFRADYASTYYYNRYYGFPVRPVRCK